MIQTETALCIIIENEETKTIDDQYIGDRLGEWTDELDSNHMNFCCCAQAKDYGYELNTGRCVGKVKGFKCSAETEEKMTNKQRKQLIKRAVNHIDIYYDQVSINNCEIVTKQLFKQWAFKFDKTVIRNISEDETDTLPYGH